METHLGLDSGSMHQKLCTFLNLSLLGISENEDALSITTIVAKKEEKHLIMEGQPAGDVCKEGEKQNTNNRTQ